MKVSELGEFGLIARLEKMIAEAKADRFDDTLLIGIGDDTAAWQCSGKIQLATVDTQVQGVHFTTNTASWREIGWKSLAINISDIAAMGGMPRYTLINLSLPPETETEDIFQLYDGIIDCAKAYKAAIAGGNISGAPQVSITITVFGESADGQILKRSTASPGDVIAVTGWPGSAAGGLAMLAQKLNFGQTDTAYFRNAFLHPIPRVEQGQALAASGIITGIDTSDGLISDLRHICEASHTGARLKIEDIPIHHLLSKYFKDKALEMALTGGEDYELLFTGKTKTVNKVKSKLKIPVHIIGEITSGKPGKIELFNAAGKALKLKKTGWTHF